MNEQQVEKSERIASVIVRTLAIIGLVAVLALVAWFIVQGVRSLSNAGAVVSKVTSVFRQTPSERVLFDLPSRTWSANTETVVKWTYDGTVSNPTFFFSYSCNKNVLLRVLKDDAWHDITCGAPYAVNERSLTITPTSPDTRLADIQLSISNTTTQDTSYVTIMNTAIDNGSPSPLQNVSGTPVVASSTTDTIQDTKDHTGTTVNAETKIIPTPTAPVKTPTSAKTTTPAPRPIVVHTPADLAVTIEDTGVYLPVAGRDTFFPVSPIPKDKRAGIVFTVTNRGGTPSGAWAFVAHLPLKNDPTYKYTSPAQEGLTPGMQVSFTLGFDDLTKEKAGVIRVEIIPTQAADATNNNTDSTIVIFK